MDAVERAVPAPQIEIIVQGRAWRQVFRDRGAYGQPVLRMYIRPLAISRRFTVRLFTARLGRLDMQLDQCPFRIGQVARVAQPATVIAGPAFDRLHRRQLPQNQAASLKSQMIHPIQYVPGQTLTQRSWATSIEERQAKTISSGSPSGHMRASSSSSGGGTAPGRTKIAWPWIARWCFANCVEIHGAISMIIRPLSEGQATC